MLLDRCLARRRDGRRACPVPRRTDRCQGLDGPAMRDLQRSCRPTVSCRTQTYGLPSTKTYPYARPLPVYEIMMIQPSKHSPIRPSKPAVPSRDADCDIAHVNCALARLQLAFPHCVSALVHQGAARPGGSVHASLEYFSAGMDASGSGSAMLLHDARVMLCASNWKSHGGVPTNLVVWVFDIGTHGLRFCLPFPCVCNLLLLVICTCCLINSKDEVPCFDFQHSCTDVIVDDVTYLDPDNPNSVPSVIFNPAASSLQRRLRPSSGAGMKRASSGSLGWGASAHDGNHFRLMRAAAAAGLASDDGAAPLFDPHPNPPLHPNPDHQAQS